MQTAELLRKAAEALGITTAKLEEVLKWQAHLANEQRLQGERLAKLENDKEWTREDRGKVQKRLDTGDETFRRIEQAAKDAERTAGEAKKMLGEVLQRKSDGTRRRSRWFEVLKLVAPYVFPAIVSAGGALWVYWTARGGHP